MIIQTVTMQDFDWEAVRVEKAKKHGWKYIDTDLRGVFLRRWHKDGHLVAILIAWDRTIGVSAN